MVFLYNTQALVSWSYQQYQKDQAFLFVGSDEGGTKVATNYSVPVFVMQLKEQPNWLIKLSQPNLINMLRIYAVVFLRSK